MNNKYIDALRNAFEETQGEEYTRDEMIKGLNDIITDCRYYDESIYTLDNILNYAPVGEIGLSLTPINDGIQTEAYTMVGNTNMYLVTKRDFGKLPFENVAELIEYWEQAEKEYNPQEIINELTK